MFCAGALVGNSMQGVNSAFSPYHRLGRKMDSQQSLEFHYPLTMSVSHASDFRFSGRYIHKIQPGEINLEIYVIIPSVSKIPSFPHGFKSR